MLIIIIVHGYIFTALKVRDLYFKIKRIFGIFFFAKTQNWKYTDGGEGCRTKKLNKTPKFWDPNRKSTKQKVIHLSS